MKPIVCFVALVLVAGCAATSSARSGDAIRNRSNLWEAAYDARDVNRLVAMYADDARFMPPHAEATGRDGVRTVIGEMMDAGFQLELETLEALTSGDVGYNVGWYTLHTPDGQLEDRGKFIETWRRVNGVWVITNDIFNSDLPAGGG
ncbi:MAG: nuclear transport factor 2 family protein [Phycisphaerales bacterium]|nr:nuclear transport factor 2 family protein [Phycisphaerales bacterium]NNM26190.1 nuclear transport factor 2 family protein [Phycisphaerales bacterium]